MSEQPHFYTVEITQNAPGKVGTEGRVGTLREPTNPHFPAIIVQSPQEFLGSKGIDGKTLNWTPEDLFVGSVVVCLFTTFIAIAERSNLFFENITISATGKLEKKPEGSMMITEIIENVKILLPANGDKEKALKILEKSERSCFIANSMKSKIILKSEISLAAQ